MLNMSAQEDQGMLYSLTFIIWSW